jgi:Ca2+-binding EF-hand superfamily protein
MKTATKITLGLLALAGAGAAVTASADASGWRDHGRRGGPGGPEMLQMLDTNDDGAVTREEAAAAQAGWLARFDADGDGSLSLTEFEGLFAELARPRMVDGFQRLDDDGDGKVTAAEMAQPFDRMARRMDRDDDGDIDEDDFARRRDDRPNDRRGWWRGDD